MSDSAKTRDIYYGGFSASEKADLETPVPPPGGSIGPLGESPLGEGRNEAGVDVSAARNKAIREAACRRHIEALRREEAAIRAGTHPKFLARAKIVRQVAEDREAEINAAATWKVEMATKVWENEEGMIRVADRAANDKDELKRLRQAEVQRLRDSITTPAPGNKFRRATRGSGIAIISDPDALEPQKGCKSTKLKSTNIKPVLGLSKDQLEDDLATLRADAAATNAAGPSTRSTRGGGSGTVGGGLRAKGLFSGGTRAAPSAVGSSSGGGSVARSSSKGKGKGKGKSWQIFDEYDDDDGDDDEDGRDNDHGKKRSRSRDDNDDDHHNGSDNERGKKRSRSRDDGDDDGGDGSDSDRGKKRSRSRDDDNVDVGEEEARASVGPNKRTKATK